MTMIELLLALRHCSFEVRQANMVSMGVPEYLRIKIQASFNEHGQLIDGNGKIVLVTRVEV